MSNETLAESTEVVVEPELTAEERRRLDAQSLVKKYAAVSAGFGLIPVPGLDVATVSSTQYAMIRDLAELYGYESSKERIRVIVSSLVGGVLPVAVTAAGLGSLVKSVPIVGTIAGMVLVPSLAAASTLALGRVFTQHFETGGTLLDIDADKLRAHFQAEFEAARLK